MHTQSFNRGDRVTVREGHGLWAYAGRTLTIEGREVRGQAVWYFADGGAMFRPDELIAAGQ